MDDVGNVAVFEEHKSLDHYSRILCRVLEVAESRVSLIDQQHGGLARVPGLTEGLVTSHETPPADTFCRDVVRNGLPLIISDARADARFREHPATIAGDVVAYAGWPLHDESGRTIGSLCAMAAEPRAWSVDDLALLADLAQACSGELHHSERRAMALENLTRAIFDKVGGVAMAFYGADGRLLLANDFAWRTADLAGFALDAPPYAGDAVYAADRTSPVPHQEQLIPRALRGEHVDSVLHWVGTPGRLIALDGSSCAVRHPDGTHWGTLIAAHDLTRLARALRVKDDFIGTVAHELRTPLTSVIAYLELVGDELASGPDRIARAMRIINRNAHDLQVRIDELLDTADRRRTLERCPTDVAALVHAVGAIFSDKADAADVTLTIDADDACWADVDTSRLRQALEKLVSNAVKFSSPADQIRMSVTGTVSEVQIVVTDTGSGMTAEEVSQSCDLFWRAESTHRSATRGLGVGLTFVRDTVEMHGGDLRIDSRPGHGTSVTLTFAREARTSGKDAGP